MEQLIDCLDRIAGRLTDSQYKLYFPGLYHGKMGVALFLCYYASCTKNDFYFEVAYRLIEEVNCQLHEKTAVNYAYGLSGIGAAVEYMVQHHYFGGDTDVILLDTDRLLSRHLTSYQTLSSFSQIVDAGKYFSFRMKNTGKMDEIKKNIERVVNLIEMEWIRKPFCNPAVSGLLHVFRDVSEKAAFLFDAHINLFHLPVIQECPFEWFRFFHQTGCLVQGYPAEEICKWIEDGQSGFSDMEYVLWSALCGKEISTDRLVSITKHVRTNRSAGLMNGLAGMGLALLAALDQQYAAWMVLI